MSRLRSLVLGLSTVVALTGTGSVAQVFGDDPTPPEPTAQGEPIYQDAPPYSGEPIYQDAPPYQSAPCQGAPAYQSPPAYQGPPHSHGGPTYPTVGQWFRSSHGNNGGSGGGDGGTWIRRKLGNNQPPLPVYQAAPWYLYWPYDGHFQTPAPIGGAFYGPAGPGNFPVNPYFAQPNVPYGPTPGGPAPSPYGAPGYYGQVPGGTQPAAPYGIPGRVNP